MYSKLLFDNHFISSYLLRHKNHVFPQVPKIVGGDENILL